MRRFVLAAIIVVGMIVGAIACFRQGPPIEYVVPTGHRGGLWVVVDPAAPEVPLVNGWHQVQFPVEGVLRVRSTRPFDRWHEAIGRYTDGTPLAAELVVGSVVVHPATVGLWVGPRGVTQPGGRAFRTWVVATEAEFRSLSPEHLAPPAQN